MNLRKTALLLATTVLTTSSYAGIRDFMHHQTTTTSSTPRYLVEEAENIVKSLKLELPSFAHVSSKIIDTFYGVNDLDASALAQAKTDIENDIKTYTDAEPKINKKITELNTSLTNAQTNSTQTKLAKLEADLKTKRQTLETEEKGFEALNKRINAQLDENQYGNEKQAVETKEAEITRLSTEVTNSANTLKGLPRQIQDLGTEITREKGELSLAEKKIAAADLKAYKFLAQQDSAVKREQALKDAFDNVADGYTADQQAYLEQTGNVLFHLQATNAEKLLKAIEDGAQDGNKLSAINSEHLSYVHKHMERLNINAQPDKITAFAAFFTALDAVKTKAQNKQALSKVEATAIHDAYKALNKEIADVNTHLKFDAEALENFDDRRETFISYKMAQHEEAVAKNELTNLGENRKLDDLLQDQEISSYHTLSTSLVEHQRNALELTHKKSQLQVQIKQMKATLDQAKKDLPNLQKTLDAKKAQVEKDLKDDQSKAKKEKATLESKVQTLRQGIANSEKALNELQLKATQSNDVEVLETQKTALEVYLDSIKTARDMLQNDYNTAKA